MRNRKKVSLKSMKDSGLKPLSEPLLNLEEGLPQQPQVHTGPLGSPPVPRKGLGTSDGTGTPTLFPVPADFWFL